MVKSMIPQAHTSTEEVLIFYFFESTYGAMYLRVPISISGLKVSATPLIPKSATLTLKVSLSATKIF